MVNSRKNVLLLPNELILDVFDSIDNPFDAVCLGLAVKRLWRVGETTIIRHLSRFRSPWNGSRLICVGEYLEEDDYPPSLFTASHEFRQFVNRSTWTSDFMGLYAIRSLVEWLNDNRDFPMALCPSVCPLIEEFLMRHLHTWSTKYCNCQPN